MKILTFDIEEWFHILDHQETETEKQWKSFDSRIHHNLELILEKLAKNKQSATFYCLGWIAQKYPEIIKNLAALGYTIGSHTNTHQLVYSQNPKSFKEDVHRSIDTIQQLTGQKVIDFRAPGFSITEDCKWAFDILIEEGIERDSSVFPAERSHGGLPTYSAITPSIIKTQAGTLKEFPINLHNIFGKKIIFSGGGYFRLLPYPLLNHFFKNSDYVMTYFHPRDFDSEQPVIPGLSISRKFKSYVGLKTAYKRFCNLLDTFEFIDIDTATNSINWDNVPIIKF